MDDQRPLVQRLTGVVAGLAPPGPAGAKITDAGNQLVAALDKLAALPVPVAAGDPQLDAAANAFGLAALAWNQARAAVADRLLEPVIDLVPVPGLRQLLAGVGEEGVDEHVALGPLTLDLKVPPAQVLFRANVTGAFAPPPPVFLGYEAPSSIGLDLVAPPMGGGGFLEARTDPLRLAGALELRLGVVDVHAFGIIERVANGDLSALVLLGAHFFPGIQLSFGFAIGAVGGLVGINRTIDADAARRRLSEGSVTDSLFPDDPVNKAPKILAALGELFPALAGSAVLGPTFQLNWGQLAPTGPAIAQADLALLIELPGPRRVALVGRLVVVLPPGPVNLVHLELDVLGIVDTVARLVSIDASLVRSYVLGVLRVTGDAAFRLSWGERPYMLLSIGGFHPDFKPEPGIGRSLALVALALDNPVSGVTIRAEGYFAVTTNTLQFGGRLEAGIAAGPVEAVGFVALDALATLRPFHFEVQFSAGFAVRFDGTDLGSITVSGAISGPGPITISASLSVDILFFEVSWGETFTIGSSVDQSPPQVLLRDVVEAELGRPGNLRGGDVTDPAVRLVSRAGASDAPGVALVAPTGSLSWSQSVVPFDTTIVELHGARVSDAGQVAFDTSGSAFVDFKTTREWFSPAAYRHLTAAEALNQPSFAELASGKAFGLQLAEGAASPTPTSFDVYVRRGSVDSIGAHAVLAFGPRLIAALAGRGAPPSCTELSPVLAIDAEQESAWTVAGGGASKGVTSETEAHTQVAVARGTGAGQVAAVHEDDRVVLGGVL